MKFDQIPNAMAIHLQLESLSTMLKVMEKMDLTESVNAHAARSNDRYINGVPDKASVKLPLVVMQRCVSEEIVRLTKVLREMGIE
jgi:hypothetical protein